jgi:hypothetical protein
MNAVRWTVVLLAIFALPAGTVLADWNIGDPHKMHYPQLPDLNGWDVSSTYYIGVADDWRCSQTGPVTDIHTWFSWFNDEEWLPEFVHAQIWTDDRSGPFSKPGKILWHKDFTMTDPNLNVRFWGQGDQGWYNPATGEIMPNNHKNIYQLNLWIDPAEAFIQQEGTIYWLELSVKFPLGTPPYIQAGWKTSISPHFEDDAVWREIVEGGTPVWQEIFDPFTGESLDMAFVITPEPGTIVMLLGAGGAFAAGWIARRRRAK